MLTLIDYLSWVCWLAGSPGGRDRCAECGADLSRPRAIRIGHRVRNTRLIALALLVILVAGAGWQLLDRQRERIARRPYRFLAAIRRGDITEVDRLLERHPRLAHGESPGGWRPPSLPLRSAVDRPRVLARLLAEHPDVDAVDAEGRRALAEAVERGRVEAAALLLRHGADPSALTHEGQPLLHHALERHRLDLARLLLRHGAAPDTRGPRGGAALHLLTRNRGRGERSGSRSC